MCGRPTLSSCFYTYRTLTSRKVSLPFIYQYLMNALPVKNICFEVIDLADLLSRATQQLIITRVVAPGGILNMIVCNHLRIAASH